MDKEIRIKSNLSIEEGNLLPNENNQSPKECNSTPEGRKISANVSKQVKEEKSHPLQGLTVQKMQLTVKDMEKQLRRLQLENLVCIDHLSQNDPSLLDDLSTALEIFGDYNKRRFTHESRSSLKFRKSSLGRNKSDSLGQYSTITSVLSGRGPKVSVWQKSEMVNHAIHNLKDKYITFNKNSKAKRRKLKVDLEELAIREVDILKAEDAFEKTVVLEGTNKLTQKIPAEKFSLYMENWLRNVALQIEKLRSRITYLKRQHSKVTALLHDRRELRQHVHAVDFARLQIANSQYKKKMMKKFEQYQRLRKTEGSARLVLSKHKNFVIKQEQTYSKLIKQVAEKEDFAERMEQKYYEVDSELEKVTLKYEKCKHFRFWKTPDITEYAKLKRDLSNLEKDIKKWQRRIKIQDIAIRTNLLEMKHITDSHTVEHSWLELKDSRSTVMEAANTGDVSEGSSVFRMNQWKDNL